MYDHFIANGYAVRTWDYAESGLIKLKQLCKLLKTMFDETYPMWIYEMVDA